MRRSEPSIPHFSVALPTTGTDAPLTSRPMLLEGIADHLTTLPDKSVVHPSPKNTLRAT